MKILVLSFYFRPDLSAGSFRTSALVDSLVRAIPAGSTIDVVTTLPHRYHTYTTDAPEFEQEGAVSITRIALPPHRSGMADQSRAFLTFARRASRLTRRDYDVVFATSSRLMTAVLGAWIARRARAPLYLDIRDIFVDTMKDVMAGPAVWLLKPVFSLLERWTIARADTVNLVSRGFASYFEPRYPGKRFSYLTNGVDDEFVEEIEPAPSRDGTAAPRDITVLYAGNLGEGQGLHLILPELAHRMGAHVRFLVVGDGGRKRALEEAIAARKSSNIELSPPVSRTTLRRLYRAADVLFLHLNDYDAFKRVLPSKIFEYAAMGKPVWAGVAGHAAEFVRSEVRNAAVFPPCSVEDAVRSFDELTLEDTPRPEFLARYARSTISRNMAEDIVRLAAAR